MQDSILNALLELTAIKSVNGVLHAENAYTGFLYEKLSHWDYFKKNPDDLFLNPLEADKLERNNLVAIVRGKDRQDKRALIFINHHDVVAIDDDDAFTPLIYTDKLKREGDFLTVEQSRDLQSGEWLFGRGVSDMKGGAAVQLMLLKEYSDNPDSLNINIIYLSLADEENDGLGVHQAVRLLSAMQKDGWRFQLCIDSEPTITNQKKENGVIYTGSIGNAAVFTLFAGKASHVGEFYSGVNAAVLAAKMVYDTEGDPLTADSFDGKSFSPASCLKLKNLANGYSVTLPDRVIAVFNVLMVRLSLKDILSYFVQKAEESMRSALSKHYKKLTGRVITFAELKERAGGVQKPLSESYEDADIDIVNQMITAAKLIGPLAVVGFIPPYCPSRINKRQTALEVKAADAVEDVAGYAEKITGSRLEIEAVYEGISDLSEMGADPGDIKLLTDNLAGYGELIKYPFEEMSSLNIPVINLGPIGKDAHKISERVHLPYLTQTLPLLLKRLVENYN